MNLKTLPIGLLLIVTSCIGSEDGSASSKNTAPASPPNSALQVLGQSDRTFVAGERFGLITTGMPAATIENLYGSDKLLSQEIVTGEEEYEDGYLLFPDTREEVTILLGRDKQPRRVVIDKMASPWHSAGDDDLRMGMMLAELTEANGGPFALYGFGWEYGGTVADWLGGRLQGTIVRLTYAQDRIGPEGMASELIGDTTISSTNPLLQNIGLEVREIVVDISGRR